MLVLERDAAPAERITAKPAERMAGERIRPGPEGRLPPEARESLPHVLGERRERVVRVGLVAGQGDEEAEQLVAVALEGRGRRLAPALCRAGLANPCFQRITGGDHGSTLTHGARHGKAGGQRRPHRVDGRPARALGRLDRCILHVISRHWHQLQSARLPVLSARAGRRRRDERNVRECRASRMATHRDVAGPAQYQARAANLPYDPS